MTRKHEGKPPRKVERDKYLTDEEFRALLAAAKPRERDYVFLYLMGNLGLRVREATLLRREHLRLLDDGFILAPTAKRRVRGDRIRGLAYRAATDKAKARALANLVLIPVPPAAVQRVREWASLVRGPWLFPGRGTGPIVRETGIQIFERARREAGLSARHSSHSWRHYRGLSVYRQTLSVEVVRKLLRHKSIKTSEVYVHLEDSAVRAAVDQIGVVD